METTAEVIRRYMREKYGYDPDISDILAESRPEQLWQLAIARAYFREDNHFERLEDAPPGIEWITVADGKTVLNYEWRRSYGDNSGGKWRYFVMNVISRNDFDSFYGK